MNSATRLLSELKAVDDDFTIIDCSDIYNWIVELKGPSETFFEGLRFQVSIQFPLEYPDRPPVVRFVNECFHPNVGMEGKICLDILKSNWNKNLSAKAILLFIVSLLGNPNTESPLNAPASVLWNQPDKYKKFLQDTYTPPKPKMQE